MRPFQPSLATPLVVGSLLAVCACGTDPAPPAETDAGEVDVGTADAGIDTQDSLDAGTKLTLRWRRMTADHTEKLREVTTIPTIAGGYVAVADGAKVVRYTPDEGLRDISPDNVSAADLVGAYVDAAGTVFVAGNKSALAMYKGGSWLVAGEVPPSPPVEFLDIDGGGDVVWAVGMQGAAWRFAAGAWQAQAVTVTGDDEAIGPQPQFTAVSSDGDDVWIACFPGAKSAGLALHKTKIGWRSFPLDVAPRDIWAGKIGTPAQDAVFVAGGTNTQYVARLVGDTFAAESELALQWKQGFNALDGGTDGSFWAAAFKGQLRRLGTKEWDIVTVEAPIGSRSPFPAPKDLYGVAVHSADELMVVSNFNLYRYGPQ